ncbi:MAG: hypothetical protein BroJett029_08100 [Alphaproteobacteria bacterium]|nr:MAG: hypothetical protein BroJett029_08100 [Alphaproteobacteria bacterium]
MMHLNKYRWIAGEPDLHDMLHDDVVVAVMRRDGVSREELRHLITDVRNRLNGHDAGIRNGGLPRPANDTVPLHHL